MRWNTFQHKGIKELYVQYTKKETLKCNDYKPITLLNIASSIFDVLLN